MNKKKTKTVFLVPVILLLTIVPLIVHLYNSDTNLAQFDWYPVNDKVKDYFLYYKSVAITLIAIVMCLILAYRYKTAQREFKLCYEFIPVGVYAVLSLISSVFSQYRYFSFHGSTEMFESVWVILGYCVIAFYTYQVVNTLEDVDSIMKWLTAGLALMLAVGILQAAGHDLFGTKFGQILLTGGREGVKLTFEKGRVFLTVYNPNYVASYFSLMIPVEIVLLIRNKKWPYRIVYSVMLVASVVCLLASGNRSGIVAFAVTAVLTVFLLHRQILKAWKFVLPAVIAVGVIFAIFISRNDLIIEKFVRLFSAPDVADDAISEIVTGDDDVTITYLGEKLHVSYEPLDDGTVNVFMLDDEGKTVESALDESGSTFWLNDERFPGFYVQVVQMQDDSIGINVLADNINWYFQKGEDGTYYFYNVFGKLDKINNAPRVAVKFLEKKFEERGTIWSKTIPMLKDCILFGSGVGTYVTVYPQDDYVDKTYDNSTTAIDVRPHCFYLQLATESGIPAMIAVVVFYIWYFISCFKLYYKCSFQKPLEIFGVGFMLATFTYMIISFLNDSTVTVAPIYWIMMGLGVAVNQILKREGELAAAEVPAQTNGKNAQSADGGNALPPAGENAQTPDGGNAQPPAGEDAQPDGGANTQSQAGSAKGNNAAAKGSSKSGKPKNGNRKSKNKKKKGK